jgi:hypothetical protein
MTAADQLELGVIDGIIDEPGEGAHGDHDAAAKAVKAAILHALVSLAGASTETLLVNRYARLRHIGSYSEAGGPAVEPEPPSLRLRLGRILRLPGVPRRPRWSEIWPSGETDDGSDDGA